MFLIDITLQYRSVSLHSLQTLFFLIYLPGKNLRIAFMVHGGSGFNPGNAGSTWSALTAH